MKIPCEECISYAICNVQIKQMKVPDVTRFSLNKGCDRLQKFIRLYEKDGQHSVFNSREISETRKFFKLSELTRRGRDRWDYPVKNV